MKRAVALLSADELRNPKMLIVKKAKYFCRLVKFVDANDEGKKLCYQVNYGNGCYDTAFGDYTYEQASPFRFHCQRIPKIIIYLCYS